MSPPPRGFRRQLGRLAALPRLFGVLLVIMLSACATIPSTGPVLSGPVVKEDTSQGLFRVLPEEPLPDATAEGIVAGFLRAAAGFSQNHQVARDYLTSQIRLTWKPDTTVEVYSSESQVALSEAGQAKTSLADAHLLTPASPPPVGDDSSDHQETKVTVRTPIEAQIDTDSRYQLAVPGQTVSRTFALVRSGGEWRISALADGILISSSDFDVTFRPFPVYFTDPTGRFLVPDLHWFADTPDEPGSPELPTALVRVLLEGPPAWLKGAVQTGAPPGTAMAVDAVVVSSQAVATVDLTEAVRAASTRQRQLLISQLETTLRQLNTIDSVQITVARLAFDVPPLSADPNDPSQDAPQPITDPVVDGDPVLIDPKGRLARLDGRNLLPVKGVSQLGAIRGANRPAVSSDSSAYAVLNADRSQLVLQLPGTTPVILIKSAQLSAPSFDPIGWVWTAPAVNTGFVYAATSDSGPVRVKVPWLKGRELVSLRLSRDGTRALVALRYRNQAHLFLAGVIRDASGRPQSLTEPIGLVPDLQSIKDVAWVDEDHVVLLGTRSSVPGERPWVVQIGGKIQYTGAVPGAESIAAGNGDLSLLVGTAKGIQGRSGALWEQVSAGRWPAFPG